MSLLGQTKRFLRALFSKSEGTTVQHSGHSLAKTLRETSHIGGGDMGGGSLSTTNEQENLVIKGHQNYTNSLKPD